MFKPNHLSKRPSSAASAGRRMSSGVGELSRRDLLRGASAAAAAGASGLSATALAAPAVGAPRDTVVLLYLRGGLDGLAACVPMFEAGALQAQRPGLVVPTGAGSGAVDLDGQFALHPGLAPLEDAFRTGELALIHAVGGLDTTRSHFAARRAIDAGLIGAAVDGAAEGWAGRALRAVPQPPGLGATGAPRGVALGAVLPRSLQGGPRVVPVNDPRSFADYGDSSTSARRRAALQTLHEGALGALGSQSVRSRVGRSGLTTVAALDALGAIDFHRAAPASAAYPDTLLGARLRDAATLILADVGTDVIHIEVGDWDDHDDMGPTSGDLAARLADLGASLAAFRADLGSALQRTTTLVYSEFGRRVDENGSRGTDHGRGGLAFALGGSVNGGQVLGAWPGLAPADLDDGAVRVTTDLRDVFAEVLQRRLGLQQPALAFPGHVPAPVGVVS